MKFSLSDLTLRDMSPDEMREAYLTDMVHVFPANEMKPCDAIYQEMLEGKFLACGLYAGGELLAYVFTACLPGGEYLFGQYVVVKETYRSMGLGAHLMDEVARRYAKYRCFMVDVEDPEFAEDEDERAVRERRIRFYLRNGFRYSRVASDVYGMNYRILVRELAAEVTDEEVDAAVRAIYQSMTQPGAFPDKFRVFFRPEDRGMARETWKRLTDKRFSMARVEIEGFSGVAGAIDIRSVKEPLTVGSVLREVVIADAGYTWLQLAPDAGGWWLTVMYDAAGELVQYYFDVTLRNYVAPDGEPRFVDLYLDLVMDPTGKWMLLDRDELDEARDVGNITEKEHALALERAQMLIHKIDGREAWWRELCAKCLAAVRRENPVAP